MVEPYSILMMEPVIYGYIQLREANDKMIRHVTYTCTQNAYNSMRYVCSSTIFSHYLETLLDSLFTVLLYCVLYCGKIDFILMPGSRFNVTLSLGFPMYLQYRINVQVLPDLFAKIFTELGVGDLEQYVVRSPCRMWLQVFLQHELIRCHLFLLSVQHSAYVP